MFPETDDRPIPTVSVDMAAPAVKQAKCNGRRRGGGNRHGVVREFTKRRRKLRSYVRVVRDKWFKGRVYIVYIDTSSSNTTAATISVNNEMTADDVLPRDFLRTTDNTTTTISKLPLPQPHPPLPTPTSVA